MSSHGRACGVLSGVLLLAGLVSGCGAVTNRHGMMATVHPLATQAGLDALRRGGNAIDATVAAGLTLGVVDGFNSGIGGGCFLLIRRSDGSIHAVDGRETAPAGASRNMYLRDGRVVPEWSQTGSLAVAVPGAVAAFHDAQTRFGRLSWQDHCERAAPLAERGFPLSRTYAGRLASAAGDLRRFPASRAIFLNSNAEPWTVGHLLRQPDLAATLQSLATDGPAWFYRGPFARRTAAWMADNGGLLTGADFAAYRSRDREPLRTTYRGHEIVGFPPPSSGGVHVAQILNLLEHFDLRAMGPESVDFVHVVTEAMKLAFADRAHWLGDPDFVKVPRGLVAKDYAATLARRIDRSRVTPVTGHGEPADADREIFGRHTTHFSAADDAGNWVACTATINTTFGSKVVIPGTGVVMNNEMDDFSAQPGVANFFGLIGAEANVVAPGKRPLSSMSPTLVFRDGRPVLSVGAAGGPTIISQTLLAILDTVDFGRDAATALARPRFHHQWRPDELLVERRLPAAVRTGLIQRGHRVREVDTIGVSQAVGRPAGPGGFVGAADPRAEGQAAGW